METKKKMNDYYAKWFISNCHRYEWDEDPVVYMKAIRVCLINLGYDEDWVSDEFRSMMESWYYNET